MDPTKTGMNGDCNVTPKRRKRLGRTPGSTESMNVSDPENTSPSPQRSPGVKWTMSPHPRTSKSRINNSPVTPNTSLINLLGNGDGVRKKLAWEPSAAPTSPKKDASKRNVYATGIAENLQRGLPDDEVPSEKEVTKSCPLHTLSSRLRSDFDGTVDEAAEAIQVLAIDATPENIQDIVSAGIIEPLVTRVRERDEPEEELAALQNLCATHDQNDTVKAYIADIGAIPAILSHVQPRDTSASRLATAVVLNLAIESDTRKNILCDAKAHDTLVACLEVKDEEFRTTVLNALTSLSIGSERRKALIGSTRCIPVLIDLIKNSSVAAETISLVQSLLFCNDDRKRRFLDAGLVESLTMVLVDPEAKPKAVQLGSRLLKGIAGFAEHEANKTPSVAVKTDSSVGWSGSLFGGLYSAASWAAEVVAPDPRP